MWDLIVSVPDHWLSFYFKFHVCRSNSQDQDQDQEG